MIHLIELLVVFQEAKRKEKEAAKKEAKEKAKRDKEAGLTL